VIVFDPLAVALIVAFNTTKRLDEEKKPTNRGRPRSDTV
jgi:hypothetical protein